MTEIRWKGLPKGSFDPLCATLAASLSSDDAGQGRAMAFVEHYNHCRYHESLDDRTPADVYFGRAQTILNTRREIKRKTVEQRRKLHFVSAA